MEKQNDYFLNLLSNPTFSANDFSQVGLSVDNTSIQDKNFYLNSDYIKNLNIFQTNGVFDQSKFDNFYDYAQNGFVDLAKLKEADDIGNTWMAYRGDISMPEYLRDKRPQFQITKVANPLRQQSGFVTLGLKEYPTQSIREIAQTQKTWDPETQEWKESPNDTWFSNFYDPKVLATWDEDGTHKDPISGEVVEHKKGDRKLNYNGTYYYERLGDRSVYGKEVLSGFDTLTTDGSFWNGLDFLDSDGIEKSTQSSLMRAALQIVPAFIPGVGQWYIGARVGLGLMQIFPALGKTFLGSDTLPALNYLEALDKTFSFSQSDYVQGSQTDSGEVLQSQHLWSWETGFKLIADVFTQLAEQRWMFEKSASLFSGLSRDVISSQEAQTKWIENYIAKNSSKAETLEDILKGLSKGQNPELRKATRQALEWSNAQQVLKNKLNGATELASKLSQAYMTGITTASSYGEAKQAGATDLEASLYALGYTLAEWKLLSSELGQWILPELKSERRQMENAIRTAMPKIKEASQVADRTSELGKAKMFQKIMKIGQDAYYNRLGQGVISETVGSTISNMASEALEETSEELLQDLSKTLFNAFASKGQFDDNFENVFDRYALSFLGGAVGGGIAGTLPAYRSARLNRSMTQEMATRALVDYVQQGKEKELLETVYKMDFGNKYLDENGNQVENEKQSQDFMIKQNFTRLVQDIKDILTAKGANLDRESLLNELKGDFVKDIRYAMLANLASEKSNAISWYLNRYNDLSSQLVAKSLELQNLKNNKTDQQQRNETETPARETELKEEIDKIQKELDKFKDGTMSDEFLQDAIFEMTSKISGYYIPTNFERWAEQQSKKSFNDLSEKEKSNLQKEYNDTKPLRRDLTRMAREVHIKNMETLAKVIEEYQTYFTEPKNVIDNLTEILLGHRAQLMQDENALIPGIEDYLAHSMGKINPLLWNFISAVLAEMDKGKSQRFVDELDRISKLPITATQSLGIETLPQTLEQLKSLDDETKKIIFGFLGASTSDLEASINNYTEKNEAGEDILSSRFQTEIRNAEKELRRDQASQFGEQLQSFLMDPDVKQEIIRRLSSAKYILPTTKQALIDFFTSSITKMDEETGEFVSQKILENSQIQEYLDAFKNVKSSPVDEYLNNITLTLKSKGIEISPLVANMEELISRLSKARSLGQFSYDDETEKLISDALRIIDLAEVGLESAATVINGDLSDVYGFNVTINEIRGKRNKNAQKLATIPADIAEGIKQDIQRYKQELLLFKQIQSINSNAVLNEHDNTFKIQSINLYNGLKTWVGHLEPSDDWKGLQELKNAIENSGLKDISPEDVITQEYKEKLTSDRLAIDKAIHNFFQENSDKIRNFKSETDRDNAVQFIKQLIKDFKILYKFDDDTTTLLNSEEKTFGDKDLLWYLASLAAADPEAIMNEYQQVLSAQYAPVIGQEEAIKLSLSYLIDPKVFKLFADAYNETIYDNFTPEEQAKFAAYSYINAFRSIFIEGLPGSGKSTATLKTLTDILNKFHPKILENVVIVSNSESNAKTLKENLQLDNAKHFGTEQFRKKIMNNYTPLQTDEDGQLSVTEGKEVEFDNNRQVYVYKEASYNQDALEASLIIIDEATSLSQMDAAMLDDFMEAKNIYGLYAGDFDQIGASGRVKRTDGTTSLITQDATNYISTHKLGQVIRGNNVYKTGNVLGLRLNKYKFIGSLLNNGPITPTIFTYYEDDSGIYGDIVAKADAKTSATGTEYFVDEATKKHIEKMVNTLQEGEKINYIYDSEDSELYKFLEENYKDKVNRVSTKAAQSQEGQYYIVDIQLEDKLSADVKDLIKATNQFKTLYTAVSRAKQATLIYERGGKEVIAKRLSSTSTTRLIKSNISLEARRRYAKSRQDAIKAALNGSTKTLTVDWKPEIYKPEEHPVTEEKTEEPPVEEVQEEEIEILNEKPEPDIDNSGTSNLNMLIHSFASNECGGTIDDTGQLVLDVDSKYRTDGVNGLIKVLKISDQNGKLSIQDTKKVLSILHQIRTQGLYGKSRKSGGDIEAGIREALNLAASDQVTINFLYKNSQSTIPNKQGTISKFFGRLRNTLLYIFTDNPEPKLRTPHNRIFALEVFVNGQQIEIPLGIFTSPLTLLETNGFQQLKNFYDNLPTKNLKKFHEELQKTPVGSIPHRDNMLKFLEIYQWNYNHYTPDQNFAIRLDIDSLNTGKITGVQTPVRERGASYGSLEYYYEGKPVSLTEYRQQMPDRKITEVLENGNADIKDASGKIAIEHGIPFILVSDYYSNLTDKELFEKYIEQINDVNSEPLITRVYVNLPKGSLDYFLFNQQEALTNTHKEEVEDTEDLDQQFVDDQIGNMLTSYRLLQFMAEEGSNYSEAFEKWILNSSDTEEQKDLARMRFNKIKELLAYLKQKEKSFKKSSNRGSKAKQLLEFLNTPSVNLSSEEKKFFIDSEGHWFIGNPKWSLRTILQYEFRKLLFSEHLFQSKDSSTGRLISLSLNSQDVRIQEKNGVYTYKDFQLDRIEALKKDMEKHNWNGIMFHARLMRGGEITANVGSKSYTVLRLQESNKISGEDITINSKLDTTSNVVDVLPIIDDILKKLVIVHKGGSIVCSSVTLGMSDAKKKEIYDENTGAYLTGAENSTYSPEELFKINCLKYITSSKPEITQKITEYLRTNGATTINNHQDAYRVFTKIFSSPQYIVMYSGNNKYDIKEVNAEQILKQSDVEILYLKNGKIFRGSTQSSITPGEALSITGNWVDNGELTVNNMLKPQEQSNTLQKLGENIFGQDFNESELISFRNKNKRMLRQLGIISDGISSFDIPKYLAAYILFKRGLVDEIGNVSSLSTLEDLKNLLGLSENVPNDQIKALQESIKDTLLLADSTLSCVIFDK